MGTPTKTKALLGVAALVLALGIAALCFAPKTAFAVENGSIEVQYKKGSPATVTSLSEAIRLANESEGSDDPATKLVLGAGTFTPDAINDFLITKSDLEIVGAGQGDASAGAGTLISTGAVSVYGQAGVIIAGDNVSIHDLAVQSQGGGNISALKIVKPGNSNDVPLVPVLNCKISNLTLTSDGHGLNIHGATGVSVDAVTVAAAGKLGISIASATGVAIDKCSIPVTGWGKDIGIMYENNAVYATPAEVKIGPDNVFGNGVLYSERPASAIGGLDTITAEDWVLSASGSSDGVWVMKPVKATETILFKDEAREISYASFEAACEFAAEGATITMQDDTDTALVVPASASGKSLVIDGGERTLSGGFTTDPGAALSSLTVQNLNFAGKGFSSTAAIGTVNVQGNTFSNITGTAVSVSNPASGVDVSENTIENWGIGGSGRAVDIAAAAGTNPAISVTENSFVTNSFDASASESFVRVSGSGLSGAIDLSHNYWNGFDPSTATAAGGVSIAELSNAGTATKVVFPCYSDKGRGTLVYENDPWPTPEPAPEPEPEPGADTGTDPKPLPTPAPQPLAKTDDHAGFAMGVSLAGLAVAAGICIVARKKASVPNRH